VDAATRQILKEAIAEVRGNSNRKWGVAIVAFGVGLLVGLFFGSYWNESHQPQPDDEGFVNRRAPTITTRA
jgi:hypothetical protein